MPITGGFCPLPWRLGGNNQKISWAPQQHARLSADLLAMRSVQPFAELTITSTLAPIEVVTYHAMASSAIDRQPAVSGTGIGTITVTWPTFDEDSYEQVAPIHIRSGILSAESGNVFSPIKIVAPNIVTYRCVNIMNGAFVTAPVSITVW